MIDLHFYDLENFSGVGVASLNSSSLKWLGKLLNTVGLLLYKVSVKPVICVSLTGHTKPFWQTLNVAVDATVAGVSLTGP